jgi:hypothetical protein
MGPILLRMPKEHLWLMSPNPCAVDITLEDNMEEVSHDEFESDSNIIYDLS